MIEQNNIITKKRINTFLNLFSGLPNIYGTADRDYKNVRVVKAPVTDKVIESHIIGKQPYGIFLLNKDRIWAAAVDFDTKNRMSPVNFVFRSKHYGIPAYIERSKSKGYHCWIFFEKHGVIARKARLVVKHILEDIEVPDVEVFPKQDKLDGNVRFGNFINAPLYGRLVSKGRSVFINPKTFKPYPNQWEFLESVKTVSESTLDEVIDLNDLSTATTSIETDAIPQKSNKSNYCLPPCASNILQNGVASFQRVSCFRMAVHFKRLGLPFDVAVAALKVWALKNHPRDGKRIIRESEIISQTKYAYKHSYIGYGCNSEAIKPFCDHTCPVMKWMSQKK